MNREQSKRTILVAGMGTSPAVLTETVWALAHQETPVVPDEITVITTKSGREALQKALMTGTSCVWECMKASLRKEKIAIEGKLVLGETSIRVFPDENGNAIDDLRTGDDNLRAADFMLGELRKYTEDTETTILCSIAGGRKTMSALLFSCMTLLGREDDKVYHVLLPPEFEGGTVPIFYFPKKGARYKSRVSGKSYLGGKMNAELFEVPFVRMRGWYQDKFKTIPPSYRALISRVQKVAPPAVTYPEIEIDAWNGWVKVDGTNVPMSRPCFAMLLLLASGCPAKELHTKLLALHRTQDAAHCDWLATFQEGSRFADANCPEDTYKVQSELRKKLKAAGFFAAESLVPQRGAPVTFPLQQIKWQNKEVFI
jgi:CRISPR-associated protein (TIGR02584 family)